MDNAQRFIQDGGTISHHGSEVHGLKYKPPQAKPSNLLSFPSAKSCRHCAEYTRGSGTKKCLACRNYKLMETEDMRQTISIIPMVSELIEAFPAPPRPDNDLMAIIRQLSSHNAALLCMCYYGSLSVREMAEVLGISQEATWKKLYRAVSNLKIILSERYPDLKSTKEAKLSNLLSPTI